MNKTMIGHASVAPQTQTINAAEFLQHLEAKGIQLWLEGEKIRCRAPRNVLTQALFAQIQQYKSDFIQLLQKRDNSKIYPLSHGQKALWFIQQLAPENYAYNMMYALRLTDSLDLNALQQAVHALVQRHPILRTTYTQQDNEPVQQVHDDLSGYFDVIDATANDQDWHSWASEEADRPFDLEQGPILRISLRCQNKNRGKPEFILLFVIHHIAADLVSLQVLLDELKMLYKVFRQKMPLPPRSTHYTYRDYVTWERNYLRENGSRLSNYWLEQLSGELPLLDLPTDHPRPAIQTYSGDEYFFDIDPTLSRALRALARANNMTLYMTLLGAFQVLLHRYTGLDDILIGTPVDNRSQTEFARVIGYYVNPVALRVDLSGNPTFREFLQRVRQMMLGAVEHQAYPFPLLVETLQPVRDPSRAPICQVQFVWDRMAEPTFGQDDFVTETLLFGQRGAAFDLTLTIFDMDEASRNSVRTLKGGLRYNRDLFDAGTIEHMAAHFNVLLRAITAEPETPVQQLPLLTERERHQLLVEWNNTAADYPADKCLHQLFEKQVEHTPDATAVIFADQQLTYRELNAHANQLAHHLIAQGVGPDVLVGLCVERSIEMVVGLLGILKAGGAYVPLDPNYPAERLAFMLEDTQVQLTLTQAKYRSGLTALSKQIVLDLNSDGASFAYMSAENPAIEVKPTNLAYVIYTSGSTGKPKGVMITHQALCNHMFWIQQTFEITSADKVLQKTPFSFDASVWEFYAPLLVGGQLVIARPFGHQDSIYMAQILQSEKITILQLVPTQLRMLVEVGAFKQCDSLRHLFCGGEPLPIELVRQFKSLNRAEVTNLYGPTEACIDAIFWTVKDKTEIILIGRPVSNLQAYILDEDLQPVPIGVAGELHIGGVQVARGYLNRPKLTAERFIDNPFGRGRLYKTGDLCRYLPNGDIEFLGRIDFQVKIRGFRIELGEIEVVLNQHPAVREAVVLAREDQPNQKRLVAYVVRPADSVSLSPQPATLRAYLLEKLPDYMVPSAFVTLEAMPLTPNGKLNRRALPAPDATALAIRTAFVAPQTSTEMAIANIWSEVLGVEKVGIHDNFFELGGDSIISLQVISRAQSMGLHMTPQDIFQAQTVSELAQVVEMGDSEKKEVQAEQGLLKGEVPLLPIQHHFFAQQRINPHYYSQYTITKNERIIESEVLCEALAYLVQQHDALRLCFTSTDEGWQQRYAEMPGGVATHRDVWLAKIGSCVQEVDISDLSPDEQQQILAETNRTLQASLDITRWPIWRVVVFKNSRNQSSHLLFIIHHLVVDIVSWHILIPDLWTIYDQLISQKPIQLPPKSSSLQAWSNWLQKAAYSDAFLAELDYWRGNTDRSIPTLPIDNLEGEGQDTVASADIVTCALSVTETRILLQDVLSVYQTQINDLLLTALVQSFAAWTGNQTLYIDLEGHGREALSETIDHTRTVGWFTALFPLYLTLNIPKRKDTQFEGTQIGDAIKSIKEQLRKIPQHGIGAGLLRYLNTETAPLLATLPDAEVRFNYGSRFQGVQLESLGLKQDESEWLEYRFDINGAIVDNALFFTWLYSRNLYRRETVEQLAEQFIQALQNIMAHCQLPDARGNTPSDFPDLDIESQAALDDLLATINSELEMQ